MVSKTDFRRKSYTLIYTILPTMKKNHSFALLLALCGWHLMTSNTNLMNVSIAFSFQYSFHFYWRSAVCVNNNVEKARHCHHMFCWFSASLLLSILLDRCLSSIHRFRLWISRWLNRTNQNETVLPFTFTTFTTSLSVSNFITKLEI